MLYRLRHFLSLSYKEQIRSKSITIALMVFILFAFMSILSSYYLKEILSASGFSGSIDILVPEITWTDLAISYYKNNFQIASIVSIYAVSRLCCPGTTKNSVSYYASNIDKAGMPFIAKAIVSILVVAISYLLTSVIAWILIQSLYTEIDTAQFIISGIWQMYLIITVCTISCMLSVWFRKPVLGALFSIIIVLLFSILSAFSSGSGVWGFLLEIAMPTLNTASYSTSEQGVTGISLAIVLTVCFALVFIRPLRVTNNKQTIGS